MSEITHEDRRIKVIEEIRDSILISIENIRSTDLDTYNDLKPQLEQYEKLIQNRDDIPLIIKNERIIKDIGRPDIEVFGGKILFEIKKIPTEYADGFNQLCKYEPFYPYAEYAVLTNYFDDWYYYKVNKDETDTNRLSRIDHIELNDIIRNVLIGGIKIELSTENIKNIFKPIILLREELLKVFEVNKVQNDALFEAYKNIMNRLYEASSEEELKDLFILHTLMQMIVSSCLTVSFNEETTPIEACIGSKIKAEIVLPYLKWWDSLILQNPKNSDDKFLNSLTISIYSKTLLLNWKEGKKEDVFRELYEILIGIETRRIIGEYYTPFWITEYMINKLNIDVNNLKDKIILDPFCGSGTFLISAFYKKLNLGEDAEQAINEVIGFDINPIAVSIARAELMIAFHSQKGIVRTPLIFNIDSASLLLQEIGNWKEISFLEELKVLEKRMGFIDSPVYKVSKNDFKEILKIEVLMRECFRDAILADDIKLFLKDKFNEFMNEEWEGNLTPGIVKTLSVVNCLDAIVKLIEKYGNGVWAVSITSLIAPHIIKRLKVDLIISNPPWNQLSNLKGKYGDLIRKKAKELVVDFEKSGQIITGSDISSVLLFGCIGLTKREIAFLMPRDNVYVPKSSYGLGKLLTFKAIQNWKGNIIQIPFDAFEHGRLPCMVFLRSKGRDIKCSTLKIKFNTKYSKALSLSQVNHKIEKIEDYQVYIEEVKKYLEITPDEIKDYLGVDDVISMGDFIRGIFGDKGNHAGLIFTVESIDESTDQYFIKLSNLDREIPIPRHTLKPYWKKLIYTSDLYPFYIHKIRNILLSLKSEDDIKNFLERRILPNVLEQEKEKVRGLINNLKQTIPLNPIENNKYYVIYRRIRTFATSVITPEEIKKFSSEMDNDLIIYDVCSYITTSNKNLAYYYSTILNFLAIKVIELRGKFERNLYTKPLISIINAGLEWRNDEWQREISKFGERIHKKAPLCLKDFVRKGMQIKSCYKELKDNSEINNLFERITEIFDKNVDNAKLKKALKSVAVI